MAARSTAKPVPPVFDELAGQLSHLGHIAVGRFFGGHELRINGVQIIAMMRGALYLKTDADLAEAVASEGGEPFRYTRARGETVVRAYHTIPADWLDDPDLLEAWVTRAMRASS